MTIPKGPTVGAIYSYQYHAEGYLKYDIMAILGIYDIFFG